MNERPDFAGVLAEHIARDRYDYETGHHVATVCTCGDWDGGYFADGESGPFDAHLAAALADLLAARDRRVRGEAVVEWGVDYHDGTEPIRADEWTARNWVEYWNTHREDLTPATLVTRSVTTTPWIEAAE